MLQADEWVEITPLRLGGVLLFIVGTGVAALLSKDGWVPILDSANLAFHEAGHPLFGLFGSTPGLYGGTLMQLVFPTAAALSFYRRRQAHGLAACGAWFGENLLNIARYMADARVQLLPLAGGGEHDWFRIFARWGVLNHDTTIAAGVRLLGMLTMAGWAAWLLWIRRAQATASPDPHRSG